MRHPAMRDGGVAGAEKHLGGLLGGGHGLTIDRNIGKQRLEVHLLMRVRPDERRAPPAR